MKLPLIAEDHVAVGLREDALRRLGTETVSSAWAEMHPLEIEGLVRASIACLLMSIPSLLFGQGIAPAQRVAVAQMRQTLRDLSTAEEAYFANHSSYTDDWRRTTYVVPTPTTHIAVGRASEKGFVGQATDDRLPGVTCLVLVGEVRGPDAAALNVVGALEPLCYPNVHSLPGDMARRDAVEASEDQLFADAARREQRQTPGSLTIVDAAAIDIRPSSYVSYPFSITDPRTCALAGHVLGLAGGNKDIEVILFDEDGFTNWKNRNSTRTIFNPGKATATTISAHLPGPGSYVLVFSNTFSAVTPKTVQARAALNCQ
jgi:hypothetical protein